MTVTVRKLEPSAFSLEETAVYLGVSYPEVRKLIRTGKLPSSKLGRTTVVRRAACDRLLHDSQVQAGV